MIKFVNNWNIESRFYLSAGSIATIPPPVLPTTMWCESDASTFRVRGQTYNTNKVKIASASALFQLICIDFFEVSEPTQNIAGHPRNRVNLALQRGDDSFVFVVNIMVPGPPYLSFVIYFVADKVYICCLFLMQLLFWWLFYVLFVGFAVVNL